MEDKFGWIWIARVKGGEERRENEQRKIIKKGENTVKDRRGKKRRREKRRADEKERLEGRVKVVKKGSRHEEGKGRQKNLWQTSEK